ncbi:MAG: hypothetical protein JXB05_00685 [Myxococcaceae bacterium]|nr:hypothetical protein [Myxococcaceae bacterium]
MAGCGGFNESPIVTEGPAVSLKDVESGTEVQMHLVVKDKDGDKITYKWIQTPEEPAGTFSSTAVAEPSWTAPEVTQATSFLLKVNILDGEGGALLSWTTIQVRPRQ